MSMGGIIGALVFTGLGLAELAVANRTLYPALRWRHETAKLTQSQGIRPSAVMALVKVQSLILLPVIGYLAGDRMKIFG